MSEKGITVLNHRETIDATSISEPDRPYVEMKDAVHRRWENRAANWPARGSENRLEPECWPELKPRFSISGNSKVFTIGSCFARNIEAHLHALGFCVPSIDIVAEKHALSAIASRDMVNVYTPTAILQELTWAKLIYERDDCVRESDVVPLLVETAPGRYIDVHSRADPGVGFSLAAQLERRQLIYNINREAFDCDLAIITLGLIETWWDRDATQSIEFNPKLLRLVNKDRFAFRKLNYQEAYAATAGTVELLLANGCTKVMITTSPIPLGFTFTDDDVIVANMHSKSVLRAVAGEISERYSGVDYFPSYESVMLTKQAEVWQNDLVHVSSEFIGKVISRVVSSYVNGPVETDEYETGLKFCSFVENEQWDKARALYEILADADFSRGAAKFNLTMALYEGREGLHEKGRRHLEAALASNDKSFLGAELYFRCARVARSLGDVDAADQYCKRALVDIRDNVVWLQSSLVRMQRSGWQEEVDWLLQHGEKAFEGNAPALNAIATMYKERGNTVEYLRLKSTAVLARGQIAETWAFSTTLEQLGQLDAAISFLKRAPYHTNDPTLFRRLASLMLREKRFSDAEQLIEQRLAEWCEDATALGLKAVQLAHTGQLQAALTIGRQALKLGTDIASVTPIVERLSKQLSVVPP